LNCTAFNSGRNLVNYAEFRCTVGPNFSTENGSTSLVLTTMVVRPPTLGVIHVIPAIPACPVRPKSGHSANACVYEDTPLAPGSSFFPQQRLQPAAQQLAESNCTGLPLTHLAGFEHAQT